MRACRSARLVAESAKDVCVYLRLNLAPHLAPLRQASLIAVAQPLSCDCTLRSARQVEFPDLRWEVVQSTAHD